MADPSCIMPLPQSVYQQKVPRNAIKLRSNIDDAVVESEYFQHCIESLLSHLQPAFHCLKFVVKILLHGPDGSGKRLLASQAAKRLNSTFNEERVSDLFDENIVGTEKKIRSMFSRYANSSSACMIYLSRYEMFCKLEELDLDRVEYCIGESLDELSQNSSQPIIFITSTNDYFQIHQSPLANMFQKYIELQSPTPTQAKEIMDLIRAKAALDSIDNDPASALSNGEYYIGNLISQIQDSEMRVQKSLRTDAECKGSSTDLHVYSETRWLDIGGLSEVKKEIIDALQMSIDYPQLKKSGLRRTGILLYGPPGTGKTMLAKAVATECGLNFISVKGPELLNEYVGQSEDNVRKLFQKARDSSPSVIFFDEIDSLAPNRGQAGDSGGVMDRVVSQLLAEMDGVGKTDGVFVIGATNRADLIDSSFLRPGRFDKVLEVPMPTKKENRLQILRALTRRMNLSEDLNLERIESLARPNMSGADFQNLCSSALQRSFDRCLKQIELGQKSEDEVEIITTSDDFLQCLN